MMTDEEVIRGEAVVAANKWLYYKDIGESHVGFSKHLKEELGRFYSPHTKAIFLDEVHKWLAQHLAKHQATCQKTQQGLPCNYDNMVAKALFFVKQEQDELPQIIHENSQQNASRHTVFLSYSHQDTKWLNMLKRHFKPLEDKIDFWDDTKINPGDKWKDKIAEAMSKAKVAVLLLSADFFNSDFITSKELPRLLEAADKDGATIFFVMLKPCYVEGYPQIMQYQGLNAPTKPFIRMSEADRDELGVNLVTQIRDKLLR
jgi:hypothetical protein